MHLSSETFYRTAGPSHKAWYWNHGLRWQTSLVCRSCGKWHAICSIRLCAVLMFNFFEHVVLRSCTANSGTSSIFMSQMAVGFWNAIRTDVSFGVFIINVKESTFSSLSCFKQCVLGLSGLLGLNAVIILPFYWIAIIVWSLEMLCLVSQAFYYYVGKKGYSFCSWMYYYYVGKKGYSFCSWMYWVPLWWFVKLTLSYLHPLVLFIAMCRVGGM